MTPAMRIAAIREAGARARNTDAAEQAKSVDELVSQIRTERDPLVRRAIQEAIAEYSTPLAREVLHRGAQRRRPRCADHLLQEAWESRRKPEAVPALRGVLEGNEKLDVKLAAADALGKINTPESIAALSLAVKDRDPALQYAGVESLKLLSGKDLGNDVKVWQQFADQPQSVVQPEVSVAEKLRGYSPF